MSLGFIKVTNCPNNTAIVNFVKLPVYPVVFSVLQQSLNLQLISKLNTFCETPVCNLYNKTSLIKYWVIQNSCYCKENAFHILNETFSIEFKLVNFKYG